MTTMVTCLNPEGTVPCLGRYSHAAVTGAGRIAYIAGQVAVDARGEPVAPGDLGAQVPVVFDNIGKVLEGLGVGFDRVLQFTSYITGDDAREGWYGAREAVYDRLYPTGAYPPNTLLIVSGLATPAFRVEVSAIARLDD